MKTPLSWTVLGICGLCVSNLLGEDGSARSKAAPPSGEVGATNRADAKGSAAPAASLERTAPELAADKATETAKRAHIRPASEPVAVDTAPPAAKLETKVDAPSANLVWVPGHWIPANGGWKWIAGEWSIPATPISVWIEPSYDAKAKKWTPGYWQPDRDEPYGNDPPPDAPVNSVKF